MFTLGKARLPLSTELKAWKACKADKSIMHIYKLLKSNIWMSCVEMDQKHMEWLFFALHCGPPRLRGKSLAWSTGKSQISEHLKHQGMFPRQKILWPTTPGSHFPPSGTCEGGKEMGNRRGHERVGRRSSGRQTGSVGL